MVISDEFQQFLLVWIEINLKNHVREKTGFVGLNDKSNVNRKC